MLSNHLDRAHTVDYATHGGAVLEHVGVQQAQKQARRAEETARTEQAFDLPQHPPLSRPYLSDLDPAGSFGNMRTFNTFRRMEKHSCSLAEAREWMAEQHVDTRGADEPLLLDPKKGLGPPRAILDGITASLGLEFRPRTLELSIGTEDPVQVVMYARDVEALARLMFRFVLPEHCTPRQPLDAAGDRIFSHPYWCTWAEQEHAAVKAFDPSGIMLAVTVAYDKTDLSKEKGAFPIYLVSNALPLDEKRKRSSWLLLGYFGSLPDKWEASISGGKATAYRRALRLKGLEAIFGAYLRRSTDNPALMGAAMRDAHGTERTVYVRLMAGIWDYPEAAASTLTLQNSTCYVCRRMTGEFQWYYPHDKLRTVASESRKVRQAWAAHPHSESARAAFCRPYGLHAVQNPYHRVPGMDVGFGVYSGATFARLHNVYEGTLPRLIEGTLRVIQKQVTAAEFNRAGKAIDAWLISTGACFKSIGTGFSKGLSHYFYGNILDSNNPWGTTISFGKIASQDVYKDICRFWRVLLVDLLPNAPEIIALFSDYFDWIRLLNNRHHTDATLARLDRFCEFWMEAAVRLFGKELFWKRVKFHLAKHASHFIRLLGAIDYDDDATSEAAHIEGAKEPYTHTNRRNVDPQMAKYVERRDTMRLLCLARQHQSPQPQEVAPAATAAPRCNVLMGLRPVHVQELGAAARAHPLLARLAYAVRLYLHLAAGALSADAHVRDMPQLDRDSLHLRPGVHLYTRLEDPKTLLGGRYLHGNVLLKESDLACIAVRQGGALWYGQLILCFTAEYLGTTIELLYVRWFDTVRAAARAFNRALTETELRGPFAAYRFSVFPGSYYIGHPPTGAPNFGIVDVSSVLYAVPMVRSLEDAHDAADPLYRLNTDAWEM